MNVHTYVSIPRTLDRTWFVGRTVSLDWAIDLTDDSVFSQRALPLKPIWRGLFINVLFYGAFWFLLLRLPRLYLRGRRAQRGWCPHCAYDLNHAPHERCP